jgi:hypothetical protein
MEYNIDTNKSRDTNNRVFMPNYGSEIAWKESRASSQQAQCQLRVVGENGIQSKANHAL